MRQSFTFSSPADGTPLAGMYIAPEAPRGIVQLVHGMAEHKERYYDVMEYLARQGYATVIHDHRGHGQCALLGHFGGGGGDALVRDVKAVSDLAKARFPGLPLYLFGHSMGCLAARCYLRRYDNALRGLFLCGTPYAAPAAIRAGLALIRIKTALHGGERRDQAVNALVTGGFNKKIPHPHSPNQWLSYNEENVAAYDADPLCGFCFTLDGFRGLMELMKEAYLSKSWVKKNPALPVVILSGAQDPCHGGEKSFNAAADLIARQGYPVERRLFDHMRHEILNETERAQVYAYLAKKLAEMEA